MFFRGDVVLLNDTKFICCVLIVVEVHGPSGQNFKLSFKKAPFFKKIPYTPPPDISKIELIKSLPPFANLINSLPTSSLYFTVLACIMKFSHDMACSKDFRGLQGNSAIHNCSHCYTTKNQYLVPQQEAKVT
jgi:hypothetical protein